MELSRCSYSEELEAAIEAAEKAGEKIDGYARAGFDGWNKEDGSTVTEADVEAQKTIVEEISDRFPGDGFRGEEEDLEPGDQDRVWIIDPVDGTFNFGKGFDYYCVSIALEVDGNVEVGVVLSPGTSRDETFFAVKDYGAYRMDNGEPVEEADPISTSEQDGFEKSLFFCSMFNIYEGELELESAVLESFSRKGGTARQPGAAALELCDVASGKADFFYSPILKEWDYSAGKLIVEEAGGKTDIEPSTFPDSHHVAASNGELHEEVYGELREIRKKKKKG